MKVVVGKIASNILVLFEIIVAQNFESPCPELVVFFRA